MRILSEGAAEYLPVDPDGFRRWVREHKSRALASKLMSAKEAIATFVSDGDYLVYDCTYIQRGPSALMRELIRQGKKDLWVAGKFTWLEVEMLVAAGCASKADTGFFMSGPAVNRAIREGRFKVYEYSNVVMSMRLLAGALGIPFIAVRSFGGTDGFKYSAAKLVEDPYSGQPTVIVPAINADVALIHVHQADVYGDARIFGPGIAFVEAALGSKKVIISAEEIIEIDDIRRNPGRTTIPYYAVDAVVHAPFGAYPGECTGYYASDTEHVIEWFAALRDDGWAAYLDKWVYSVSSHEEMLEKGVGVAKLLELQRRATIKEGYRP